MLQNKIFMTYVLNNINEKLHYGDSHIITFIDSCKTSATNTEDPFEDGLF